MNNLSKLDYKKQDPKFYKPSTKHPTIVTIPEMNYFMVDGIGLPSKEYEDAIELLYKVSYTLKMKIIKKETPGNDYVVPPLEGLWYMDDMSKWSMENKNEWNWTMMIRIPDFVSKDQIKQATDTCTEGGYNLSKLRNEVYYEGESVQIMYIGPYDEEPPTIQRLHQFAFDQGYKLHGKHHEIYISDPRKVSQDKLKTIIRQPITK